jgi:biotin operon repressor
MDKLMNQKEVKHAQILDLLKASQVSQQEVSKRLGISTRQVRRLP